MNLSQEQVLTQHDAILDEILPKPSQIIKTDRFPKTENDAAVCVAGGCTGQCSG